MDVLLPVYQDLYCSAKFKNRLKQWNQICVLPENAAPFLLEVMKFLGILALILVNALILLMAG